jgi:glucokinase
MTREIVLAADLGGTNLRIAVVNCEGDILYRTRRETPRSESPHEVTQAISASAKECLEFCPDFDVKMISVAIPGTVNVKEGVVITCPNLSVLNNFAMAAGVEKEVGIRAVLENDANAAAVGESWRGASAEFDNSICLTLGTGIGGGIMIDGKVLRGVDGAAGEIGHICVEASGVKCGCGSRGCIEQYASASAIVRAANELKPAYPGSILHDNANLQALEIFSAGQAGDDLALEVFRRMGFYLGVALSDLINILNPGIIVIGGGAGAGWELFAPHMHETIRQRAFGGAAAQRAPVVRGILGDDAGLLGAARLAFDELN